MFLQCLLVFLGLKSLKQLENISAGEEQNLAVHVEKEKKMLHVFRMMSLSKSLHRRWWFFSTWLKQTIRSVNLALLLQTAGILYSYTIMRRILFHFYLIHTELTWKEWKAGWLIRVFTCKSSPLQFQTQYVCTAGEPHTIWAFLNL